MRPPFFVLREKRGIDSSRHTLRIGGEPAPSARTRKDRDHSPDTRARRRSWAQLIMRVYEVDPLVCPKCGGEMRIIAFIIDHVVVDAILRHLAKTEAQSPRGPPTVTALSAAF